ncbi:gas vesicle protein [Roseivivax halodurans JCM 10272]|uniref:Gas vesicle protein n=1 Tax=Roseivivax halodurans JCM 10272 TaxID=1449350 RepID=X7EJ19_9RHOB|nr:gas vesicle protein GvpO [Roseivivax halodurans]ETX15870.1 gas vesicle protein [Roseivivax halodurans JCM 10272]
MTDQPDQTVFHSAKGTRLTLGQAIARIRAAVPTITDAPVDAIRSCERLPDAGWRAIVEVIESAARMGDNDLLSAYEMELDATGELTGFHRTGRYHREAGGPE